MKAFYLCRVVADPDGGWTTVPMLDPNYSVTAAGITIDPVTKAPVPDWVLCHVAGRDLTALNLHPDVIPVPVVSKDAKLSTITSGTRSTFDTRCTAWGITVTTRQQDSMRDLLNEFGQQGSRGASFDVDGCEVADLE